MSATFRTRLVPSNQLVMDQADFFGVDGFTRVTGITVAQVTGQVFFQNQPQPWVLQSGEGVPDTQVVSGRLYFSEVNGMPGFYSLRWRPNAVGFWRILLNFPSGLQSTVQDYDVVPLPADTVGGLKSAFMKPNC